MCFLCTPKDLSSMIQLWKTSCSECTLMATSSSVWGEQAPFPKKIHECNCHVLVIIEITGNTCRWDSHTGLALIPWQHIMGKTLDQCASGKINLWLKTYFFCHSDIVSYQGSLSNVNSLPVALAVLLLSTVKPKIINKEKTMVLVVLFFFFLSLLKLSQLFSPCLTS